MSRWKSPNTKEHISRICLQKLQRAASLTSIVSQAVYYPIPQYQLLLEWLRIIILTIAIIACCILLCFGPHLGLVVSIHLIDARFDLVGRQDVIFLKELALAVPLFGGDAEAFQKAIDVDFSTQ